MPKISLSDFIHIASAVGFEKAKMVSRVKHRGPYSPASDFYKPLREEIAKLHKEGRIAGLVTFQSKLSDSKKIKSYGPAISGYLGWVGKRSATWFDPPRAVYGNHGIDVAVNPEIGVEVGGSRYVVKLYMALDAMSKTRIELVPALMELALRSQCRADERMALLDVRHGKLYPMQVPLPQVKAVVDAELGYIANLWNLI